MNHSEFDVVAHIFFAFDIGYEIDLERARPILAAESGALARRRRTPESLQYRPGPLRISLDASGLALPGGVPASRPPRAELSLFDFGAISFALRFPLKLQPEPLLRLAGELADLASVTTAARLTIEPWLERIKLFVTDYHLSDLGEEYIVFQFVNPPAERPEITRELIAGLLRLEPEPLSSEEVAEALRLSLSYMKDDRVILDWAAGFIDDRDCEDTLQVIEFANVQHLEYRHIDDRLDDRLEAAYRLIRSDRSRRRDSLPWRGGSAAVRHVRELEIEATSLFERVDNNLKLIGDQYLSRVFDLAQQRFHLSEWQQSIRRKLDVVGDVYDLLIQQAEHGRMEMLEIIVIVLIALEIVLALVRH